MSKSDWIGEWKEHIGLILGTVSALFVAIRILSLAQFNPETAYGILEAGGTAAVIIGALLSAVGQIALIISMICVITIIIRRSAKEVKYEAQLIFVGILFGLVSIVTAPFLLLCLAAATIGIGWIRARSSYRRLDKRVAEVVARNDPAELNSAREELEKTREDAQQRMKAASFQLMIGAAIVLGLFTLTAPPWYPSEKLDVKGFHPQTVYVLSEDQNEIAVLNANTRQLEYFDVHLVESRELCSYGRSSVADALLNYESLPGLFNSFGPQYTKCPNE